MTTLPSLGLDRSRRDWTSEELREIQLDRIRYEVVDGRLLANGPPSVVHQDAVGELFVLLRAFAKRHDLHCVMSPAVGSLWEGCAMQPDLLVMRVEPERRSKCVEQVTRPVLVVEVCTTETVVADRFIKRRFYQNQGVDEYWVVEPVTRLVERWRPADEAPDIEFESMSWVPCEPDQPLVIDLAAYFRRVHGE